MLDGVYSGVVRKASVDNVTALLDKLGSNEAISS